MPGLTAPPLQTDFDIRYSQYATHNRPIPQIIANMTALAWRPDWQSLLANGTVNNPELNNLTGIVYGTSACSTQPLLMLPSYAG